MEKMYFKKHNCLVHVYNIYQDKHLMALIWTPGDTQNGSGWMKVRAKELVPMEYFDGNAGFQSKSYRNRIKQRLQLVNATWECTDGTQFDNVKQAIDYESVFYEMERKTIIEDCAYNGELEEDNENTGEEE